MTSVAHHWRFRAIVPLVVGVVLGSGKSSVTTAAEAAREASGTADVVAAEKPLCGAYCLFVGLLALDVPLENLDVVQKRLGSPPRSGYSFAQLAQAAESFGLHTLGVETTLERLRARTQRFVCIAHLRSNHFVNIAAVGDQGVTYCDPPAHETIPAITFNTLWDGKALLLAREPLIPEEEIRLPRQGGQAWLWMMAATVVLAVMAWRLIQRNKARRDAV
jgi:ABC-type bacteriocin/lantibiotic exporter with double-glycine peptidase domain